ncbi:MAG TPA: PAS domain S-box protein [Desulfobacterales bacterium]|nr:PAS domain S-box protein [Desulfobacterales bacterium]
MMQSHNPQQTPGINVAAGPKHAAARHQEERQYRSLVEVTSDWIWEVDPEGRYTFSNRAVADILGYPPEEVIGRTPFDFMPPAEAARIRRDFGAISATKKPFAGLENVNLHKSGRRVVLETSGVPIIDEQGGFRGFRGIDRDVTARKKLEEELKRARNELEKKVKRNTLEIAAKQNVLQQEIITRKQIQAELACSEHQFQSLVETLNEGFGIVDAEGRLTYVNAKFLDMLGYVRSEIVGEKIGDFMDERNRRLHQKQLAMRQRGIETPYEIQFATKAGGTITTIVSPRATFDAAGRFQGSFAVVTDISAMKSAEKALRRREQQLREKTLRLQEMNTALEVLLRRREQDKTIIQKRILVNLRRLVAPYLDALGDTRLSERQRFLVDLLKSNLGEIMSPFSERLTSVQIDLTRTELEVANLIRLGKSTTQVAAALNISYKTAESHRWRIRKKLGLTHKKANLMSYLSRLQDPL